MKPPSRRARARGVVLRLSRFTGSLAATRFTTFFHCLLSLPPGKMWTSLPPDLDPVIPEHAATMLRFVPFVLLLALTVGGCAPGLGTSRTPAPPANPLLQPESEAMDAEVPGPFKVLFETTAGDFVLEVEPELAPVGARRFYNLVRHGYYDGVRFFRVVPGFVVQFGLHPDPEVSGLWREQRIPDDSVATSNLRGMVSYAMAGPDTRTVQLFINLVDNTRLDDSGFAPFARVTGGMDTVDRLHGGYGDSPPRGEGPVQDRITAEGEDYLASEFPLLDRIVRARILPE
ncbi:MAG: peptidylprolyl isomerase [Gemmatimonadales bacterium]|nr:MAG: peptidylprolyl isomerase [Gemmatimonadales bacterium]